MSQISDSKTTSTQDSQNSTSKFESFCNVYHKKHTFNAKSINGTNQWILVSSRGRVKVTEHAVIMESINLNINLLDIRRLRPSSQQDSKCLLHTLGFSSPTAYYFLFDTAKLMLQFVHAATEAYMDIPDSKFMEHIFREPGSQTSTSIASSFLVNPKYDTPVAPDKNNNIEPVLGDDTPVPSQDEDESIHCTIGTPDTMSIVDVQSSDGKSNGVGLMVPDEMMFSPVRPVVAHKAKTPNTVDRAVNVINSKTQDISIHSPKFRLTPTGDADHQFFPAAASTDKVLVSPSPQKPYNSTPQTPLLKRTLMKPKKTPLLLKKPTKRKLKLTPSPKITRESVKSRPKLLSTGKFDQLTLLDLIKDLVAQSANNSVRICDLFQALEKMSSTNRDCQIWYYLKSLYRLGRILMPNIGKADETKDCVHEILVLR